MKKSVLLFMYLWCFSMPIYATTIIVNTTTDEADGSCFDGDCSLRDAITVANGNGEADLILIPAGTYTLTLGSQLTITDDADLRGAVGGAIIQAATTVNTANFRVFRVNNQGTNVAFYNMTIRHGVSPSNNFDGGGGVYINIRGNGTAFFQDVIISDNRTGNSTDDGGGLYINPGGTASISAVTMTNCIIRNNNARDDGGGIYINEANNFTMTNCLVDNNFASDRGGGIWISGNGNSSITNISNSTICNNRAANNAGTRGGGIWLSAGISTLTNCSIINNSGVRDGGGIYDNINNNFINLYNCTVAGNTASDEAGGLKIINTTGETNITNCIIADNTAPTGADILLINNSTISNAADANHSVVENCVDEGGGCPSSPAFITTDPNLGGIRNCASNTNLKVLEIIAGSSAENIGKPVSEDSNIPNSDICGAARSTTASDAGAHEIGTVLPVELIAFKGKSVKEGYLITWSTASEIDNKGFEIQRSQDAKIWETLDFVKGHGTTLEIQNYQWTDTYLPEGVNYYRLKQIDHDGEFEYSKIIASNKSGIVYMALVFSPNPANSVLNYEIVGIDQVIETVKVYNLAGKMIKEFPHTNGSLMIDDLETGTYILVTKIGNRYFREAFIKN